MGNHLHVPVSVSSRHVLIFPFSMILTCASSLLKRGIGRPFQLTFRLEVVRYENTKVEPETFPKIINAADAAASASPSGALPLTVDNATSFES